MTSVLAKRPGSMRSMLNSRSTNSGKSLTSANSTSSSILRTTLSNCFFILRKKRDPKREDQKKCANTNRHGLLDIYAKLHKYAIPELYMVFSKGYGSSCLRKNETQREIFQTPSYPGYRIHPSTEWNSICPQNGPCCLYGLYLYTRDYITYMVCTVYIWASRIEPVNVLPLSTQPIFHHAISPGLHFASFLSPAKVATQPLSPLPRATTRQRCLLLLMWLPDVLGVCDVSH